MTARTCGTHGRALSTDGLGRFWCDYCNHEQRLGYMSDHVADCRCDLHRFREQHGRNPTLDELRGV